jgi:DNA helicase IV
VLATLQPDQYRLVTWPQDDSMIVQGSPGTGKTIVAAHRAAYLVHPDREGQPLRKVGFFGPTPRFAEHVGQAIRELSNSDRLGVDVNSLPHLLAQLAGLGRIALPKDDVVERFDTDWAIWRLVRNASSTLRRRNRLRSSNPIRELVDALIRPDPLLKALVEESGELATWIRSVRSFDYARTHDRYLPFLAAAGLAVESPTSEHLYDHLIIDEAQDVRPLEWRILEGLLRPGGQWSLFGDMHQRRSLDCYSSWQDLAVDLEITDDAGERHIEDLGCSYRTTAQILRYAARLLPRGERDVVALRTGPEPIVQRADKGQVYADGVKAAALLAKRYAAGMCAVIGMKPSAISDGLRRCGWKRQPAKQHAWTDGTGNVAVLHPSVARGLEFDAVVVVEPGDFPTVLGHAGPLYTSLTRAVHELTIVHERPLPKGL